MNQNMCLTGPLNKLNVFTIAINVKTHWKKKNHSMVLMHWSSLMYYFVKIKAEAYASSMWGNWFSTCSEFPNGKNNTPKRSSETPFTYWSQLFLHEQVNPYPARQHQHFHKIEDTRVWQTELILIKIAGLGYLSSPRYTPISSNVKESVILQHILLGNQDIWWKPTAQTLYHHCHRQKCAYDQTLRAVKKLQSSIKMLLTH